MFFSSRVCWNYRENVIFLRCRTLHLQNAVCKSETLSTWVAEHILYAINSAPDKWCTLFSHQTGQLSGSSLATVSSAAPTTPSTRDHGMQAWRLTLYQFLSLFLQVVMHVLTSSSVLAPSNVHKLVQMQNVSSTMHTNMQMPWHWQYLLQRLKKDEMLHPLTLPIKWLLMSCHSDEHQIPTLRTSVRLLKSWHSE